MFDPPDEDWLDDEEPDPAELLDPLADDPELNELPELLPLPLLPVLPLLLPLVALAFCLSISSTLYSWVLAMIWAMADVSCGW